MVNAVHIVKALGIVSMPDVLGLITFGRFNPSVLPPGKHHGTHVLIKAGLSIHGDQTGQSGMINGVQGFDINNDNIGKDGHKKIKAGAIQEFTLDQKSPGVQADYISVKFGKNDVCVAWILVTPDIEPNGVPAVWTGDIGHVCGQPSYWSTQTAGTFENGTVYRPRCTWFDGNKGPWGKSGAMKFDVRAFGQRVEETLWNGTACKYNLFQKKNKHIIMRPGPSPPNDDLFGPDYMGGPYRRDEQEVQKSWIHRKIVISPFPEQTAHELCAHPTSWGPDFIDSKGYHCDLTGPTRIVTPLCSTRDVEGCLMLSEDKKTLTKRTSVGKREVHLPHKTYEAVDEWKDEEAEK